MILKRSVAERVPLNSLKTFSDYCTTTLDYTPYHTEQCSVHVTWINKTGILWKLFN